MTPPDEIPQQPRSAQAAADSAALAPAESQRADVLYEQGMACYQRRDWRKALDNFKRLKAIEPNWPGLDPLIDEASWLLQLEQVDAHPGHALEEERAERRMPLRSALRWAIPLLVAGAVLAALAWWQGWLPNVGDRLEYEALYNRGQASLAVGDYQGAQEAFAVLAQLAPNRFDGQRAWSRLPWPTKRPMQLSQSRTGTQPRPACGRSWPSIRFMLMPASVWSTCCTSEQPRRCSALAWPPMTRGTTVWRSLSWSA